MWVAAVLAGGAVLFWCYLRQSQTTAVNADGSGMALQGWEMLHGNRLVAGGRDVLYVRDPGERPGRSDPRAGRGRGAHLCRVDLHAARGDRRTAREGNPRGAEGVIRAPLGAGVMVAPSISPGTRILILSPDHIGVGVPILVTLLLVDRAPAGLCQREGRARFMLLIIDTSGVKA
jgi:hypothetical protein